jgi:hypothetical protein
MADVNPLALSPLIWLGVVLLVLIGGLALRQRAAAHTPRMPALPPADDTIDAAADEIPPELPNRVDPILGPIGWNGDAGWYNLEPFEFDGRQPQVLLLAGPEGPGEAHQAWLAAVVARGETLACDARTLVAASLGGQVTADQVTLDIITMGDDEHGRFIGGFSCRVAGLDQEPRYVWSRDRWATLSLDRG